MEIKSVAIVTGESQFSWWARRRISRCPVGGHCERVCAGAKHGTSWSELG